MEYSTGQKKEATSLSLPIPLPQFIPAFLTTEWWPHPPPYNSQIWHKITLVMLDYPWSARTNTQRVRVMKNSSISQRLPKLTRGYKTFHQYPYASSHMMYFSSESKSAAAKIIRCFENFCMVMQWTLKTIMLTFFDALHQRRCNSSRQHVVIY